MAALPEPTPTPSSLHGLPADDPGAGTRMFGMVSIFALILLIFASRLLRKRETRVGATLRQHIQSREENERKKLIEHKKRLSQLDEASPVKNYGTFVEGTTKNLNDVCVTCLEDFKPTDDIRVLRCGHIHHSACLELWASWKHYCCPTCRAPFEPQQKSGDDSNVENAEGRGSYFAGPGFAFIL